MDPSGIRSAQFIDTYFPIIDGVVETVHSYAALLGRDAYTCVVAPKGKGGYDDGALPYDVFRARSLDLSVAEYALPAPRLDGALKKRILNRSLDLVHAHSPFFMGGFARACARRRRIPFVATFHSKYYDDALHLTGSRLAAELVAGRVARFYEKADSVWACSRGTAETLKSYGYRGEIFVMDNGTTFRRPADPEALKCAAAGRFALPRDKKLLLFVGHLIWHKNLRLILDAFRLVAGGDGGFCLLVAGDGYDGEAIRGYADGLGLPPGAVRFLGRVEDRDLLAGLYLNADLFFFPSVYDNAPLVVREAASLGVPSLLAAGSNAAEAVEKDVSGFTAEADPAAMAREIRRVFSEEGLLARVGEGARQSVARPWEEIVPRVREKYAEVVRRYRADNGL